MFTKSIAIVSLSLRPSKLPAIVIILLGVFLISKYSHSEEIIVHDVTSPPYFGNTNIFPQGSQMADQKSSDLNQYRTMQDAVQSPPLPPTLTAPIGGPLPPPPLKENLFPKLDPNQNYFLSDRQVIQPEEASQAASDLSYKPDTIYSWNLSYNLAKFGAVGLSTLLSRPLNMEAEYRYSNQTSISGRIGVFYLPVGDLKVHQTEFALILRQALTGEIFGNSLFAMAGPGIDFLKKDLIAAETVPSLEAGIGCRYFYGRFNIALVSKIKIYTGGNEGSVFLPVGFAF